MLRIATASTQVNDSTATLEAPCGPVSGGAAPRLDRYEGQPAKQPAPHDAGFNWGASVIPWLTEEFRFHSVLDLGCGNGRAVDLLNDAGYEAHGIDRLATTDAARKIACGDIAHVTMPDGYFDLVLCADVLNEIEPHRVSMLLAEMNRLSNSYFFIIVPTDERRGDAVAETRSAYWWCNRLADFGWRLRLLREDPETGHVAIFAEKRDSLAAKVLPLLDEVDAQADATATDDGVEEMVRSMIASFRAGDWSAGWSVLSTFATVLERRHPPVPGLEKALKNLLSAVECQDMARIVSELENSILPALAASRRG